jgi:uncharacterized protein (DUF433 family)
MKKALAGVLAVALVGVLAGSAMAQVPNIQVYFDSHLTQTQTNCPGTPPFAGPPVEVYVVMNNWNMNVTAVDFSIAYPPSLQWITDNVPDPSITSTIGNSPTGIAIAYANAGYLNGFETNVVLRPLVLWGVCDCNQGPQPVVVGGYYVLGKTQPSAIRKEDFAEFSGVGMTSLICAGPIATEASTWGQVKALYR